MNLINPPPPLINLASSHGKPTRTSVHILFRQTGPREGVGMVGPTGKDGGRRGSTGATDLHQVSGSHSKRIGRATGAVQLSATGSDQAPECDPAVRRARRLDG